METLTILNEIFNSLLKKNIELTLDSTPQDIEGWDSLFQAQLVESVESKFGMKFKLREILSWDSVGNIITCIEKHK